MLYFETEHQVRGAVGECLVVALLVAHDTDALRYLEHDKAH
jgi:hypothetical protein